MTVEEKGVEAEGVASASVFQGTVTRPQESCIETDSPVAGGAATVPGTGVFGIGAQVGVRSAFAGVVLKVHGDAGAGIDTGAVGQVDLSRGLTDLVQLRNVPDRWAGEGGAFGPLRAPSLRSDPAA